MGERIFSHFQSWEDYQNGMYDPTKKGAKEDKVQLCVKLLSNPERLWLSMRGVVDAWRQASDFNLSNSSYNRRAWLGRSACQITHGAHLDVTRKAWSLLNDQKRKEANEVAERAILYWKNTYYVKFLKQRRMWDNKDEY